MTRDLPPPWPNLEPLGTAVDDRVAAQATLPATTNAPATTNLSATAFATAAAEPDVEHRLELPPPLPWQASVDEPRTWRSWIAATSWTTCLYVSSGIEWAFGLFSIGVGLAILSSIPVLCLLNFGYLLEISGRIGRTGKFTAGFIGIRQAARLGSIILGAWIVLLPLRATEATVTAARLIGNAQQVRLWSMLHIVLCVVLVTHIAIACGRGGRLRHFFWPLPAPWVLLGGLGRFAYCLVTFQWGRIIRAIGRRIAAAWGIVRHPLASFGAWYYPARDTVWDFALALRLPYYFSLGFRGFVATWIWLLIPTVMLAAGQRFPAIGFLGAFLLAVVVLYLPFLQARFASENRFRAMFELRAVRRAFCRAPLMFLLALSGTLLFALPLYLLYIEYPPEQILALPAIVFVAFIVPARFLAGLAYACAMHRERLAHWLFRWPARLLCLPVAAFYVLILFFVQYVSQDGRLNLFDQHAFVMPFMSALWQSLVESLR